MKYLSSGPADLMWAAVRRFTTFRMLAARGEFYEPIPVADLEHILHLVGEARAQVDASTAILRALLVVSVAEMDKDKDAAIKIRHAGCSKRARRPMKRPGKPCLRFPWISRKQAPRKALRRKHGITFFARHSGKRRLRSASNAAN
jgi:hypothetical protein